MPTMKTTAHSSEFGLAFAAILKDMLRSHEPRITQAEVGEQLGRKSNGRTYVGDQLRGRAPVSVDVVEAAATLMGMSPRALVQQIMREMGREVWERPDS